MRRCAFTLAETLITLAIIGVIAALTIPTLMTKYQERVAVSRAKQTYAQLSNAFKLYERENDCNGQKCFEDYSNTDVKNALSGMMKHLKVKETFCGADGSTYPNWLAAYGTTKNLDGTQGGSLTTIYQHRYGCQYLLENGVTISVMPDLFFGAFVKLFIFDINGKKPPNQAGKDTFHANVTQEHEGLEPEFRMHSYNNPNNAGGLCSPWNCFGKENIPERHPLLYVLTNDKLPDLSKVKAE